MRRRFLNKGCSIPDSLDSGGSAIAAARELFSLPNRRKKNPTKLGETAVIGETI
jgi:hypothetical protein